jgi:hypothetical protein
MKILLQLLIKMFFIFINMIFNNINYKFIINYITKIDFLIYKI